jgi:hypothetical protein
VVMGEWRQWRVGVNEWVEHNKNYEERN